MFILDIGGFIYELYLSFIHRYFLRVNIGGLYELQLEFLDGWSNTLHIFELGYRKF